MQDDPTVPLMSLLPEETKTKEGASDNDEASGCAEERSPSRPYAPMAYVVANVILGLLYAVVVIHFAAVFLNETPAIVTEVMRANETCSSGLVLPLAHMTVHFHVQRYSWKGMCDTAPACLATLDEHHPDLYGSTVVREELFPKAYETLEARRRSPARAFNSIVTGVEHGIDELYLRTCATLEAAMDLGKLSSVPIPEA